MSSQNIIIALVLAVVLIGGGWYLVANRAEEGRESTMMGGDEHMEQNMQQGDLTGEGSFRSLIGLGEDLQCTFSYDVPNNGGHAEGTMYLSDGRMRGDFTMSEGGNAMESHIIRAGDTGYSWGTTPSGTIAVKFAIQSDTNATSSEDRSIDLDQDLQYDCNPWSVDASRFTPPQDIEFQDMSAQMQMMQENSASVNASQCAACEQIVDPTAKNQCLTALGCN